MPRTVASFTVGTYRASPWNIFGSSSDLRAGGARLCSGRVTHVMTLPGIDGSGKCRAPHCGACRDRLPPYASQPQGAKT
ncbi:hypothetical protein GCM10009602_08390 [Nocardiopsis tropica]